MATLVVNVSGGNLHLDSVGVMLPPGGRKEFDCTETELHMVCPELAQFKVRSRVMISEDAVIVAEESKKPAPTPTPPPQPPAPTIPPPAPVKPVKTSAPVAPVAPVAANIEVEEPKDEDA